MHNLHLYYRKDTNLIDNPEASHTVKFVTTLTDHLRDKGYDLYTDQFYTSPLLPDTSEQMGIRYSFITQTKIACRNQKKIKITKSTTESYICGNIMALAWQDKRTILMRSTKYNNKMI